MQDSIVVVLVEEYKELVRADALLQAAKRVVRANRAGMPETLSDVLDVRMEQGIGTELTDLGYME